MKYIVNTSFLNLRRTPEIKANVITALPKGQNVVLNQKFVDNLWSEISTEVAGITLNGFVASRFLIKADSYKPPPKLVSLKAIHREENRPSVTRSSRESGWSYPLGEIEKPSRKANSKKENAEELTAIINWIQVESSKRYQATSNSTYCNIYAHDYCYLSGTYLPRVWWKSNALSDLSAGRPVIPGYDQTYKEMNANELFDWLVDFGEQFGWTRTFDIEKLQEKANEGNVCLISAKNKILSKSGHICAVVPETDQNKAYKSYLGFSPLISQAGRKNYQYKSNYNWWHYNSFSQFGFWLHE